MKYYIYFHDDSWEVEYNVEYDAVYQPAKLSGPPDRCYPDESSMDISDFTVTSITKVDAESLAPQPTDEQIKAAFEKHENERLVEEACWNDFHDHRQEVEGCCGRYYYA
jgi:hypothetical protein